MNWNKYIIKELNEIYGPQKAGKMSMTVVPGLMMDFQKMLLKEKTGTTVSEEYMLDDGRAKILIDGRAGTGIERVVVRKNL